MKKIILFLFVCLCAGSFYCLSNSFQSNLAIFLGITGSSLLGTFCYLSYLETQRLPDIRKEVESMFQSRDEKIAEIKNHMGKFDMSRSSYQNSQFKF